MNLDQLRKKMREKKSYRKVEWNAQWDIKWEVALALCDLRILAGMTQKQLGRKMKVHQESISRAEANGCSIDFLNRAARACGCKIEIKVIKAKPFK